jgi:DNA-directed RNA polymerase specialized sigma24 family protein
MSREFASDEEELAWLIATQEDGGLPAEKMASPKSHDRLAWLSDQHPFGERLAFQSPQPNDDLAEVIEAALEQLPPRYREAVEAHVFQGLGSRRIARLPWIDGTKSTVHRHLQAGLEMLQEILENDPIVKGKLNAD